MSLSADQIRNLSRFPIEPFEDLPLTMVTATSELVGIENINLDALFLLMKVLHSEPVEILRKEKIPIPPHLNIRGKIISMRYKDTIRGFRRSIKEPKTFPNAITIEIGGYPTPVYLRLSKTPKLYGLHSIDEGTRGLEDLLKIVEETKTLFDIVKSDESYSNQQIDKIIEEVIEMSGGSEWSINHENSLRERFNDPVAKSLIDLSSDFRFIQLSEIEYPEARRQFMKNILALESQALYKGDLKFVPLKSVMINLQISFSLQVNHLELRKALEPYFECKYSNAKNSPSTMVNRWYEKQGKGGKINRAKLAFKVNTTGYITYSGPSFSLMKPVYENFMARITKNFWSIFILQIGSDVTLRNKHFFIVSEEEWVVYIRRRKDFINKIANDRTLT